MTKGSLQQSPLPPGLRSVFFLQSTATTAFDSCKILAWEMNAIATVDCSARIMLGLGSRWLVACGG